MKAVLIEDELPSLDLMERMVKKNEHLELAGAYTDPNRAFADIVRLSPDVVFADVEMPGVSGMELARRIRAYDENIQIVFVTAHSEFAVEAFQVNAVNYILKPVTEEDLNVTVNRLMRNRRRIPAGPKENRNRILTLGSFEAYGDFAGRKLRWPTAKVRELFACFVAAGKKPLEKWQLCERLWPQSPPQKAEHSLHSAVSRMRNALRREGVPPDLSYGQGMYWMDLGGFSCDAWELEEFLGNSPEVCDANITSFQQTLSLYRGDLFKTEDYVWCLGSREKLKSLYLGGLKKVGRYEMEKEDYGRAEKYLQKALRADPLAEETAARLLEVYYRTGQKEKLVHCFQVLRQRLGEELGIAPKAETVRLYQDYIRKL